MQNYKGCLPLLIFVNLFLFCVKDTTKHIFKKKNNECYCEQPHPNFLCQL